MADGEVVHSEERSSEPLSPVGPSPVELRLTADPETGEVRMRLYQPWSERLQLLHGVLLSASVGAFAAGGQPEMLTAAHGPDGYISLWTFLAGSTIVVAFDAWYQFSRNAPLFKLEGKAAGYFLILLIGAIVWTSFLPFQFLVRTLTPSFWEFTRVEPVNRLFGLCLCVTLAVGTFIALLVAIRTREGDEPRSPDMVQLNRKSLMVFLFRLACTGLILWLVLVVVDAPTDQLSHALLVMAVWGAFRVVEHLTAIMMDRAETKRAAASAAS